MAKEIQFIIRQWSVYFNEEDYRQRPDAGLQIFKDGDRGIVYSLLGHDFLANCEEMRQRLKDEGLTTLEADMIPEVSDALSKVLNLKVLREYVHPNGVRVNRIEITL